MSSLDFAPCARPSVGTKGKPTQVIANYYAMRLPDIIIYQYDVKISPELDRRDLDKTRPIWQKFEAQYLPGCYAVYDGRSIAYSPKALPFGPSVRHTITLREAGPRFPAETYQVTLVKTNLECKLRVLSDFVSGKIPSGADTIASLQCLNILFHEKNDPQFLRIRESFFKHDTFVNLSGGLEIYKGIFQSVRCGVGRMLLNVDTAVSVMHARGSLINLCVKFLNLRDPGELNTLSPQNQRKLKRIVKGLRIYWTHRGDRGLTKDIKIKDITTAGANAMRFQLNANNPDKKTEEISVAAYFERAYNIKLKYPALPCVIVQKDNQLPMEVCELLPGQKFSNKLGPIQVAEMIKTTCVKPADRLNSIEAGVKGFDFANNEYIKAWGLEVAPRPIAIKARTLPPPKLEYNASSQGAIFEPKAGAWDARGKKMCKGAILGSWAIINFNQIRRFPEEQVRTFCNSLVKACTDMGMTIKNKTPPIIYANPAGNIQDSLREAWVKAGNFAKAEPQIIVCIVPAVEATLYAEIKRIMNTDIGCASQCLVGTKLNSPKGVGQYCGNVCLKLNAKLGGANVFLPAAYTKFISERPTIVFGADINHPGKGEDHVPSFCALTGSMDARASRYSSACRAQASRQEIIQDLRDMVVEILVKFYSTSGQKPERLIFYRDGVSEGQFQQVLDGEVKAIRDACKSLDATYAPTITFVVCQKRHHTRFFPATAAGADRTGNLTAGLVCDTDVTHPSEYDFYLLSHAGLQGTSKPCHYRVLMDENKLHPDDLQSLTYNLTYMYTRCTRSLSIVPAVRYADQIALLERYHYNSSSRAAFETESLRSSASPSNPSGSASNATEEEMKKFYAPVRSKLKSESMWW